MKGQEFAPCTTSLTVQQPRVCLCCQCSDACTADTLATAWLAAGAAHAGRIPLSSADGAMQASIMQHIEDFLLGQLLPLLGPGCRSAAAVEAAVSEELLDLHLANAQLGQRLSKW